MTIVDLKKEYSKQLDILKNDKNGIIVRSAALDLLTGTYQKIIKLEPKCPIDSPAILRGKYIIQTQTHTLQDVIWYGEKFLESKEHQDLLDIVPLEKIRRLAYVWVKKNHPILSDQGDKFGQIVNARMHLIIAERQ